MIIMANFSLFGKNKTIREGNDNYETPGWIYEKICQDFNVYPQLDVCATKENRKCKEYFDDDALNREWDKDFFMNSPYSQANKWVKYAYFQHLKHNVNGIAILNVSTDTSYWHNYIFDKASIVYYKGRIKFELNGIPQKNPRYASAFICWHKRERKQAKKEKSITKLMIFYGL